MSSLTSHLSAASEREIGQSPADSERGFRDALGRLADAGIPLGNQSVLLRGVNDNATVSPFSAVSFSARSVTNTQPPFTPSGACPELVEGSKRAMDGFGRASILRQAQEVDLT